LNEQMQHHMQTMGYSPNPPLTRRAKVAIGTITGLLVVGGVVAFWPRTSHAAPPKPDNEEKKPTGSKRPPGEPPNPTGKSCLVHDDAYDQAYWDQGGTAAARARIFEAFQEGGYATPTDRDTMNALGGDQALGGNDDLPNPEVKRFQNEYNAVSRWGGHRSGMGGLAPDGFVGPCTINGLKYAIIDADTTESWQEIVAKAKAAGFNP
jgi:hypothetical protein